jgi:predicted AlkP superfamily pyrophosphatase or phosphodiesterase
MPRSVHRPIVAFAVAAAATLTFSVPLPGVAGEGSPEAPRVVLVSIDGLMPDYYQEADRLGLKVPHLRRLVAAGSQGRVTGVLPTVTYPSHTTLITGVPPRLHGIVSNTVFDPEGRSNGAWHWFARDVRVPSLVSAARARWLTTASVAWPASVGMGSDFNVPEFWRPGSEHPVDLKLLEQLSSPGLLDAVAIERGRPIPYPVTDADRADTAVYLIRRHRPQLLLLHLIDLDGAQHDHGPRSLEALAAAEAVDSELGKLLGALEDTRLLAHTLVAVVSDHGFLRVSERLYPNTLLREAGLVRLDDEGKVTSWKAWFHASGGSAALYLADPADGGTLDVVRRRLEAVLGGPESGLRAVLGPAEIEALGGDARAALWLDAREGFHFGTDAAGAWRRPSSSRGYHGYAPGPRDLHAALVLAGPGIPAARDLGEVHMTRIAPTLAGFLGIPLGPEADAPLDLR